MSGGCNSTRILDLERWQCTLCSLLCSVVLEDDGFSEKSLNLIEFRLISMPLDPGKYCHKFGEVA